MGFAPLAGRFGVGTDLPAIRGVQSTRKTSHYKIEKRSGGSIFLETRQVAATQREIASRNGFVSEEGSDQVRATTALRINRSIFGRQAPV
jgi:hypothetical protein